MILPSLLLWLVSAPPPVAVRVVGGGIEPVTVVITVTVTPHVDNRAICLSYEAESDTSMAWRGCWELQGERAPKTTQVTSNAIVGAGEYRVYADLCRGHWDGNERCAAKWLRSNEARFFVIGRGNIRYPLKGRTRR